MASFRLPKAFVHDISIGVINQFVLLCKICVGILEVFSMDMCLLARLGD